MRTAANVAQQSVRTQMSTIIFTINDRRLSPLPIVEIDLLNLLIVRSVRVVFEMILFPVIYNEQ